MSSSSSLVDIMGRDERIAGDLSSRSSLVGRGGAEFALRGDDSRLVQLVSDWWDDACPPTELQRLVSWSVMSGVSYGRLHWDRGLRHVRIEAWDNHWLSWDESRGCYVTQTADQGLVDVRQGTGEWILLTPGGHRSWMTGAVRALGESWLLRSWTRRDWARYCERHGMPILAIREPGGVSDEAIGTFYAELSASLGSRGVIKLPQDGEDGFGVEFIEASDGAWETFRALQSSLARDISIRLLGQNLTSEVDGGSYAAAQAHLQVRQDLLSHDAEVLSDALRRDVIVPWLAANVGQIDPAAVPWPHWQTAPTPSTAEEADTLAMIGDALGVLAPHGVDVRELAERFGVPLLGGRRSHQMRAALDPVIVGQEYADRVTESLHGALEEDLRPHIERILEIVNDESIPEAELADRITAYYAEMDPTAAASSVHAAMMMAQHGGVAAVQLEE